jgi:hypothetical protein
MFCSSLFQMLFLSNNPDMIFSVVSCGDALIRVFSLDMFMMCASISFYLVQSSFFRIAVPPNECWVTQSNLTLPWEFGWSLSIVSWIPSTIYASTIPVCYHIGILLQPIVVSASTKASFASFSEMIVYTFCFLQWFLSQLAPIRASLNLVVFVI